jgi:hypothetical protein
MAAGATLVEAEVQKKVQKVAKETLSRPATEASADCIG